MKQFLRTFKRDLPAGLVVFLVALPLCLGIALASGAPLFSGIISGIIGGTVVAMISGSPLGVSGPAAGLAVIVYTAIGKLGSYETFLLAVVLAGIFQIILGYVKAGIIAYYFPSAVIRGMLSAIGVLIIIKQIPHAFGYDTDPEASLAEMHEQFSYLEHGISLITPGSAVITLISLLILILWELPFIKVWRYSKIIQGPLIVVVLGIILNLIFNSVAPALEIPSEQMVALPIAKNFNAFIGQFTLPDFSQLTNSEVYITGLTIAIVASLETLLCVEATDKLDPYKRTTPVNQELKAQGIGNMVSGLIGGIPITQVIVRSSANILSGGRTKLAAIIHGFTILITVIFIPGILNMIPLASLAAILIVVGYKLAKVEIFKSQYKAGLDQFIPFIVTVLAVVFTDLLNGIGIGMTVSVFYILKNNFKTPYFFHKKVEDQFHNIVIQLSEHVSFLNKASVLVTLDELPRGSKVLIDVSKSVYIDPDVIEVINNFKTKAHHKNIHLELKGMEKFPQVLSNTH